MIRYKEIAFIAYPVTGMARARRFYEGVLGLKSNGFTPASKKNPKFIEYDLGAGTLAIGSSAQFKPSRHGASAALEVEDFDEAVATLKRHRIKFVIGPIDGPICRMVLVRDPDGNQITLHHRKPKAKRKSN
jgi:predicted enzyme related to lactoylglutathione lyase